MNKTEPTNQFQPKGTMKFLKDGSILNPQSSSLKFILNAVNMAGKADTDFYKLLDKKWPRAKSEVRKLFIEKTGFYKLGAMANTVALQSDVWLQNMIVQDVDLKTDLVALEKCLMEVCKAAKYERASVHLSMLLIETIPELKDLTEKHLVNQGVSVYFYQDQNEPKA